MVEYKEKLPTITSQIEYLRNLDKLNRLFHLQYAFSPAVLGNTSFIFGEASQVIATGQRFAEIAGFNLRNLVFMDVNHGTSVAVVGQEDKGRGVFSLESAIKGTDALVTTEKGVMLGLNIADCAPIIITNPETQFLALVHAGREGTDKKICQKVVFWLEEMGFSPRDFVVGIGPAIGACGKGCYRLRYLKTKDVASWKKHVVVNGDEAGFWTRQVDDLYIFEPTPGHTYLNIDLVGCNIAQLVQAGIPRANIENSSLCTACLSENGLLFSHQKSGGKTGRFMTVAMLG